MNTETLSIGGTPVHVQVADESAPAVEAVATVPVVTTIDEINAKLAEAAAKPKIVKITEAEDLQVLGHALYEDHRGFTRLYGIRRMNEDDTGNKWLLLCFLKDNGTTLRPADKNKRGDPVNANSVFLIGDIATKNQKPYSEVLALYRTLATTKLKTDPTK